MRARDLRVVLVTALVVAPAAVLAWSLFDTPDTEELDPAPVPLTATATVARMTDRQAVLLTPVRSQPVSLVAPAWNGVVTAVYVSPGEAVASGDAVIAVDGVDRIAMTSDEPLHRPLQEGAVGDDVRALNGFLAAIGQLADSHAEDTAFSADTAAAVSELSTSIGVEVPTRVADPSWFVWMPAPVDAREIATSVGAAAPAQGEQIVLGRAPLESVHLTSEGGQIDLDGDWVLSLGGDDYPLVDGEVDAESLTALGDVLPIGDEVEPLSGEVARESPEIAVVVPSSALAVGPDGSLCIWLGNGGADGVDVDQFEPRPVVVAPGSASQVKIADGLEEGETYLANPADVLEDPACPSR